MCIDNRERVKITGEGSYYRAADPLLIHIRALSLYLCKVEVDAMTQPTPYKVLKSVSM